MTKKITLLSLCCITALILTVNIVSATQLSGNAYKGSEADHSGITVTLFDDPQAVPFASAFGLIALLILTSFLLYHYGLKSASAISTAISILCIVSIVIAAQIDQTTTVLDGSYAFNGLGPGVYYLQASATGWRTSSDTVVTLGDQNVSIDDIYLEQDTVPTSTPVPTDTLVPSTNTPVPTDTPVPPTNTPVPTDTPVPTETPVPPTNTPVPTDTPIPTDTPVPNLKICEIMCDPASDEDDWEWIEVYNSGSTTIDLTGWVLDDGNTIAQTASNIASGSVAAGETAILFNDDDLDATDFQAAWGTGFTLIGVTSWSRLSLNNSAEKVSLWDSYSNYAGDHQDHTNTVDTVSYLIGTPPWPNGNGAASIYLIDLGADNDYGSNWALSTDGGTTPAGTGYTSTMAGGNSGADIGSPEATGSYAWAGGNFCNTDNIIGDMYAVPATGPGGFTQGTSTDECKNSDEGPPFTHILTRNFAVMETEVTRQMWADLKAVQTMLPSDPSSTLYSPGMTNPVQRTSWYVSVLFANLLSVENNLEQVYYWDPSFSTPIDETNYNSGSCFMKWDAAGYRLMSEGEWEYACRAGTTGPFHCDETNYSSGNCYSCSSGLPTLEQYAVYCTNDPGNSETVGSKLSNPWNLKDMHGNISEWCWDRAAAYPGNSTDYTGPTSGANRIHRGGNWDTYAASIRSARRGQITPDTTVHTIGFRLARTLP